MLQSEGNCKCIQNAGCYLAIGALIKCAGYTIRIQEQRESFIEKPKPNTRTSRGRRKKGALRPISAFFTFTADSAPPTGRKSRYHSTKPPPCTPAATPRPLYVTDRSPVPAATMAAGIRGAEDPRDARALHPPLCYHLRMRLGSSIFPTRGGPAASPPRCSLTSNAKLPGLSADQPAQPGVFKRGCRIYISSVSDPHEPQLCV